MKTQLQLFSENPIETMYTLINSKKFHKDLSSARKGNKSAGRRVRKVLLEISKKATAGRKEILMLNQTLVTA